MRRLYDLFRETFAQVLRASEAIEDGDVEFALAILRRLEDDLRFELASWSVRRERSRASRWLRA